MFKKTALFSRDGIPKPSQGDDLFVLGAIQLFDTNNKMEPFYFMSNLCGCYATTRNLLMEGGGERDERIFTADSLDICSKAIRNENVFFFVEIVFLHDDDLFLECNSKAPQILDISS